MSFFRGTKARAGNALHPKRLAALIIAALVSFSAPTVTFGQDVFASTGVIIKRTLIAAAGRQQQPVAPRNASRRRVPTPSANAVSLQLVEDALALGNAQREASPPRVPEAERAYNLASKLNPKDARPSAWLGDLYFEQQRFPEAEAALRRAVTLDASDAISFVRLSYLFTKLGRMDEAEQAAQRVQQIVPNEYYGYCSMGWSKFRRKNYTEAETEYRRAIELSPKTAGLYSDMGLILLSQKKYPEAMTFLRQALEITPENVSALINYGVLLQRAGRINEAQEHYARAVAVAPQATQPRSNLGVIHYLKGEPQKARENWTSAVERGSVYALDRAGLFVLDDKLNEALHPLSALTTTSAENVDAWLMLGDVRRAMSDETGAQTAYARGAELAPEYARLKRPAAKESAQATPKSEAAPVKFTANRSPLREAAARGQKDRVRALLTAGGNDPNAQGHDGGTALMLAAANGHTDVVKLLLQGGAQPNLKDGLGQTALFYAVGFGFPEVARALLDGGADPNVTSTRGVTPLKLAQSKAHVDLMRMLQQAGAQK